MGRDEVITVSRVSGDPSRLAILAFVVISMVLFVNGLALAKDEQALLEMEGIFQRAKLLMKKRSFDEAAVQLKKIVEMKIDEKDKARNIGMRFRLCPT